jgi:hypothetical protein
MAHRKTILSAVFALSLLSACSSVATDDKQASMADNTFKTKLTVTEHMAKTQYYRWYQLYEGPLSEQRINNQMEILSDDLVLETSAGTMKGKSAYPERVKVYEGWQNAHHVQNVAVTEEGDAIQLEADIRYQNITPDQKRHSYAIHYSMQLEQSDGALPTFSAIKIAPTGKTDDTFVDAYAENRTKSLMHYWLGLMEQLQGNVTPFTELLADDFQLNFSTTPINSVEEFQTWLNGTPSQLKQSSHYPENFSVKSLGENRYEVRVDFDWYGIMKNDTKLRVKTAHTWQIIDNPEERFAKITRIDVKQIEPLRVVK